MASATCGGIVRRLDYLPGLVSTPSGFRRSIPSPMADFGYDIVGLHATSTRCSARCLTSTGSSARRIGAGSSSSWTSCPTTRPISIPGSWKAAALAQAQTRLVHLARSQDRRRPAQQLDQQFRRQRLGMGRDDAASTTTTPFSRSSPISIGATRRCAPPCMT